MVGVERPVAPPGQLAQHRRLPLPDLPVIGARDMSSARRHNCPYADPPRAAGPLELDRTSGGLKALAT